MAIVIFSRKFIWFLLGKNFAHENYSQITRFFILDFVIFFGSSTIPIGGWPQKLMNTRMLWNCLYTLEPINIGFERMTTMFKNSFYLYYFE